MQHFDERTIDLFVQNPDLLHPGVVIALTGHIRTCPTCRGLESLLREFYRELSEFPGTRSAEVDAIMQRLMPMHTVIHLTPYRPIPTSSSTGNRYVSVMAAMSHGGHASGSTVATLASERDHVVLRVRMDDSPGEYRLFLHTDDPRKMEGVLVQFPELPADVLLDEKGQAHFHLPSPLHQDVWAAVEAVAHYPVIAQVVHRDELLEKGTLVTEPLLASGKCMLTLQYQHNVHSLLLSCSQPEFVVATVRSAAGKSYLIPLVEGKGRLELAAVPEEFIVRLYTEPSASITIR